MFGDGEPFEFLKTPFNEAQARFSPDDRWVAYQSDESGRNETYIAAFPSGANRVLISSGGGTSPRWRRDGREIVFLAPDGMLMAAQLGVQRSTLEVTGVQPLFRVRTGGARIPYAITDDAQRFLVLTAIDDQEGQPITILVNWHASVSWHLRSWHGTALNSSLELPIVRACPLHHGITRRPKSLLVAGVRFGADEVIAPLGARGIGEAYRARDSRLKREIALKATCPQ